MSDPRIEELRALLPRSMLYDWVRLGSRLARLLRDTHHPARHDALIQRLLERARASVELREWRTANRPEVTHPPELPITARSGEILEAIRNHQVVVVAGETGSGKTTQIPKICLEAGLGIEARIGCTQPRRVAALSVSRRIAEELGVSWGREVGCKIRFDDRSSPETFIKMMTDGMLLAEVQGDPLLSEYNAIILDEAHERSLNIDFLLGHLKGLLARRTDLKLVITSATIDTEAFSKAFGDAPIIEVSGRLYPVEVTYEPLDPAEEESGDLTYVDAAVRATMSVMDRGFSGDVLVFMPGERDIREVSEQLETRCGDVAEIVPLYGRLSSGDQQRIFASGNRRRVVVSTNIAETSLTIPGIRFVIDSGLARVSRYNPRTRTRRLPIEPISQSSANQRKGRAGRVSDGACIRLYSEEDFAKRPAFTQPEIQRSNLAEVILRMKAFHLGDIETFPFLNPPSPAAIQTGYTLLHELGALDDQRELTPLGSDLARLPIDPTLGRMLLQSQHEHATRELLIIASGLSIQDPRERPLDQQAAADAAHRRHAHPTSDFLTLLNLWNAVHDQWESLRTQNQRRKFCRTHFLSYVRMREWQDLHAQLRDALEELGSVRLNESNAAYEAVHRSILSGLLGHVARREERNQYKALGNRAVMLFPGSMLFERAEKSRPPARGGRAARDAEEAPPKTRTHQPRWIVAGEIVETSQVFARTVAGIEPAWIIELAPHLCKVSYQNPSWSASAGNVLAEEVTTLSGLELQRRRVSYGQIDPKAAREIFIRKALVEEELTVAPRPSTDRAPDPESWGRARGGPPPRRRLEVPSGEVRGVEAMPVPPQFGFLAHNRAIRETIESWETRVRRREFGDLDDVLYEFYAARLPELSSRDELSRWLRDETARKSLHAVEDDLTGGKRLEFDRDAFPDSVVIGGQPVPLSYAYAPGEEHDGVTIRVPFTVADAVSSAVIEWAVPGLREAKAEELLRALPKSLRTQLLPIAPKAAEIARNFEPKGTSFHHDLARFIQERYGVAVPPGIWSPDAVPLHLRPRVEVLSADQRRLAAGRDLGEIRRSLATVKAAPVDDSAAWNRAKQEWERHQVGGWTFGDLPERVTVDERGSLPVYAWPGLEKEGDHVHVRLFRSQSASRLKSIEGVHCLVERALQKELAWLHKDLRALKGIAPLLGGLGTLEEFEERAFDHLRNHVLAGEPLAVLNEAGFKAAVDAARQRLQGLAGPWIERIRTILDLRAQILRRIGTTPEAKPANTRVVRDLSQLGALAIATANKVAAPKPAARLGEAELANLIPPDFPLGLSYERLQHLPRYLKALWIRLERSAVNPPKDRERALRLAPYLDALRAAGTGSITPEKREAREALRWMLEEFRVSLFAQELGTAVPVSEKRLNEQLEQLRMAP